MRKKWCKHKEYEYNVIYLCIVFTSSDFASRVDEINPFLLELFEGKQHIGDRQTERERKIWMFEEKTTE